MKKFASKVLLNCSIAGAMLMTLSACNHDQMQEYQISITNITNEQPLSPPVAMLHNKNFSFWKIGEQASNELEVMAEGGDGSGLLSLRRQNSQYGSTAPLFPGESIQFNLRAINDTFKNLSVAGMLINTNDGFSGLNGIELIKLEPGQTSVYYTHVYDAGTEFNSELSGTIPGPSDGGEGFNAARDDVTSVVTSHGGIVSVDDNFADSTLNSAHKFDNPALRIVITAL